jgi:hypothetical protein
VKKSPSRGDSFGLRDIFLAARANCREKRPVAACYDNYMVI